MQCLRLGVVLVTTLTLVNSMPPETMTTRYTSYEAYDRFPLYTTPNLDKRFFLNLPILNTSPHISDISPVINQSDFMQEHRNAKLPKDNEFYREVLIKDFKSVSDVNNTIGESRKLTKKVSDDEILLENYLENFIDSLITPKKPVRVNTVNKSSTKNNKNTHRISTNSTKLISQKISNSRAPDTKENSSVLLSVKKGVQVVGTKDPFRIKVPKLTTTTKAPSKVKQKSTTPFPTTRFTTKKPITIKRYSINLTRRPIRKTVATTSPSKRRKPTVHKIITKWSDTADLSELKQNWYEEGVPYPNPNPEISSYSPPVSLNDVGSPFPLSSDYVESVNYPGLNPEITSYSPPVSLSSPSSIPPISENFVHILSNTETNSYSPPVSLNDLSSVSPLSSDYVDSALEISPYSPPNAVYNVPTIASYAPEIFTSTPSPTTAVSNPLSVFNLDMVPDQTKDAIGGSAPCPSIHISSSLLGRQQRQECSDLNLVINSHIHQNQNGGGTRNPTVSTYDAEQAPEDAIAEAVPIEEEGQALDGGLLADPGVADAAVADPGLANSGGGLPAAAAPPAGGTGGTGGSGGDGDNGGGLKFPDLKNLFDAIGYLGQKLWMLLGFLKNPYLYLIPMALFFALGFFTVLALFPWWIPILVLYLSVKTKKEPKDTVAFYKHVHPPLHHPDGWFWNHQTKTWQNVEDFAFHKKKDGADRRVDQITELIKKFKNKYADNTNIQSWKRRRRSK